jgi:RES domain-containing protein
MAYSAAAFSGQGAADNPGRWNTRGMPVVYTAESRALACLEILANDDAAVMPQYAVLSYPLEQDQIAVLDPLSLPAGWQELVHPSWAPLQALGRRWFGSGSTLAFRVPSAHIEGECNYLINPAHPDFDAALVSPPRAFWISRRLFRPRQTSASHSL